MAELFLFVFTAVLIFVNHAFRISDTLLKSLLSIAPVLPWIFYYYSNKPRLYLRYISLKRSIVQFKIAQCFDECYIDEKDLDQLIKEIRSEFAYSEEWLDNSGELLWQRKVILQTFPMTAEYYVDRNQLYILYKGETIYRNFLKKYSSLNNGVGNFFRKNKCNCTQSLTSIRVDFLDGKEKGKNPFVEKIFKKFKKHHVSIEFIGSHGSRIKITNHAIELVNSDYEKAKEDYLKELRFHWNPFS